MFSTNLPGNIFSCFSYYFKIANPCIDEKRVLIKFFKVYPSSPAWSMSWFYEITSKEIIGI